MQTVITYFTWNDIWLHRLKYSAPESNIALELYPMSQRGETFGSAYIWKTYVSVKLSHLEA